MLGDHQGDLKTFWGMGAPAAALWVLPKALLWLLVLALGMHLTLGWDPPDCTDVHGLPTPPQCAHMTSGSSQHLRMRALSRIR